MRLRGSAALSIALSILCYFFLSVRFFAAGLSFFFDSCAFTSLASLCICLVAGGGLRQVGVFAQRLPRIVPEAHGRRAIRFAGSRCLTEALTSVTT